MKGLSPMIAVVLLVAFTVGIGGILSLWLTGLTTSQTQTVSNSSNAAIQCTPSLVITKVRVPPASQNNAGLLNVTVENHASFSVLSVTIDAVNSTNVITNTAIGNMNPGATGFIGFTGAMGGNSLIMVKVRGTCQGSAVSATCDPTQTCWELAGS